MQTTGSNSDRRRRDVAICLLLALITVILYWPVSRCEFNNYDDAQYITKNPVVQAGLRADTVSWAFTTGYAGNWHPLTWLSHMLDCQLYGLNSGGHHLTNLLIHVANTLLLFGLLRWLTGAVRRAAFVAALFAWHPMHVESVAWVAERKDVLSAFFALLTLIAYAKYAVQLKFQISNFKFYYWLAVVCFALGLMAKPMLVSLPLIMLLLDYWPLNRIYDFRLTIDDLKTGGARKSPVRLLFEKLPFCLLSLLSCYVTYHVQKSGGAMSITNLSLADRVAHAVNSYIGYVTKMLWPQNLCILYPYPHGLPLGRVMAAGAVLLLISATALLFIRRRPWLAVGWFWFLIMLIPVIGLVQVGEQAMADRYSYLPYIGLFVLLAWEIPEIVPHRPAAKTVLALGAGLALVGCLVATSLQLRFWKNSVTLFSRAASVTTGNFIALGNLGEAYASLNQPDAALREFDLALGVRPNYIQALNNKGSLFSSQGRLDEAITVFNQALAARPNWYLAHRNLGLVFFKQGKLDEAIAEYRAAIKDSPTDHESHTDLGLALAKVGRLDDAITQYRQALQIAPDAYAENALGGALQARGKNEEAAAHFLAAVEIKPDFADAQNNLGALLNQLGNYTEARQHLMIAVKLLPDSSQARCNLGSSLLGEHRFSEAATEYSEAIRLQNDNLEAHFNLGNLLLRDRQWNAAARHFAEVLRLEPDSIDAHVRLASALAHQGDDRGALEHYRAALRLDPRQTPVLRGLAWILATSSDSTLRDGAEAVRLSTVAAQSGGLTDAPAWDVQAAACAEAGQFADAVSAARKALELGTSANQKELAAEIQARLQLYESGRAYHQPPGAVAK